MPVNVAAVADAPSITLQAATGDENATIPLTVSVDPHGGGVVAVIISDVPAGATLSAGTHNPDGSWTLTIGQLNGLTLTPPAHTSGDFNLTITAINTEGNSVASASASLPISIDGVANAPTITIQAASGAEDNTVPLTINVAANGDGNETLSITITGVPAGATLSAGTHNARW